MGLVELDLGVTPWLTLAGEDQEDLMTKFGAENLPCRSGHFALDNSVSTSLSAYQKARVRYFDQSLGQDLETVPVISLSAS